MRVEIVTIMPDARRLARAHDAVEIGGEVRKIEMAVVVDEHVARLGSPSLPSFFTIGRGSG